MRNIIEYPITKEEIVKTLHELRYKALKDESIGNMKPLLIQEAIKIIEKSEGY